MVQSMSEPAGNATPDLAGHWVLAGDGARAVRFTTRHLFGLQAVHGTFDVQRAEVDVGADARADLLVDVASASFSTGHKKRDPHVHSPDFLDVADHPVISFSAAGLDTVGSEFTVSGTLRIRDHEAPVTVTGTVDHTGHGIATITGETTIDRYAHQVTKARGMAARRLKLQIVLPLHRV